MGLFGFDSASSSTEQNQSQIGVDSGGGAATTLGSAAGRRNIGPASTGNITGKVSATGDIVFQSLDASALANATDLANHAVAENSITANNSIIGMGNVTLAALDANQRTSEQSIAAVNLTARDALQVVQGTARDANSLSLQAVNYANQNTAYALDTLRSLNLAKQVGDAGGSGSEILDAGQPVTNAGAPTTAQDLKGSGIVPAVVATVIGGVLLYILTRK